MYFYTPKIVSRYIYVISLDRFSNPDSALNDNSRSSTRLVRHAMQLRKDCSSLYFGNIIRFYFENNALLGLITWLY